nr:MAG TPA: hypothetical protein [Bacteriophage sp.]
MKLFLLLMLWKKRSRNLLYQIKKKLHSLQYPKR